jgi:hypothetical protein
MQELERAGLQTARAAAPELRETMAWGDPWLAGNDLVGAVSAFASHVGVEFYRGPSLADPTHLIEGTGTNLRHVKVRTVAGARAPALHALMEEAARLDAISQKRPRGGARSAKKP